jgi:hypothetical protein
MRAVALLSILIAIPSRATKAQEQKPSAEIGTSVGVTLLTAGGNTITTVGIPVDEGPLPLFARPALYATFFPSRSLMVEPQLAFTNISGGGGGSFTMFLLFTPEQRHSPYLGANVAFSTISANGSLSGLGIGGAAGYRFRVGTGFAMRIEWHYRRWLNDYDGLNEIGLVLGLGGII